MIDPLQKMKKANKHKYKKQKTKNNYLIMEILKSLEVSLKAHFIFK